MRHGRLIFYELRRSSLESVKPNPFQRERISSGTEEDGEKEGTDQIRKKETPLGGHTTPKN